MSTVNTSSSQLHLVTVPFPFLLAIPNPCVSDSHPRCHCQFPVPECPSQAPVWPSGATASPSSIVPTVCVP